MRDVPLGTLIFRAGLLAEEQLEDALQEGMRKGKRLGEVLLERGWLHERDLGRLLAGQKGLPFVEVRASDAEPDALKMLPEEKARMQNALPLRFEDGQLVVAVADPSNELVIENLRRSIGSEPRLVVAPHAELIRAIGEAYARRRPVGGGRAGAGRSRWSRRFSQRRFSSRSRALSPSRALSRRRPCSRSPRSRRSRLFSQSRAFEQEQPIAAPVVTALPTVIPPAETRDGQAAESVFVEPLVSEAVEQPLVTEPTVEAVEQPLVTEPAPSKPSTAPGGAP